MTKVLHSAAEMLQCGFDAAVDARAGDCFALVGDLGAGKTHWTQGFVHGLSSNATVTSPTFGLAHEYRDGRLSVCHLDLHRIHSQQELIELGWDEILETSDVVIAEWADKFPELMPSHTRWLRFFVLSDTEREIREMTNPVSTP